MDVTHSVLLLLLLCRPLFASSLLSIMNILLDQTGQDELRVIGCQALFVFVNNQVCTVELHFCLSITGNLLKFSMFHTSDDLFIFVGY